MSELENKAKTLFEILEGYAIIDNYDIEMLEDGRREEGKEKWVRLKVVQQEFKKHKKQTDRFFELLTRVTDMNGKLSQENKQLEIHLNQTLTLLKEFCKDCKDSGDHRSREGYIGEYCLGEECLIHDLLESLEGKHDKKWKKMK